MGRNGILKQLLDKIGLRRLIEDCEALPTQNFNRTHRVTTLLESFMTSIWCGVNRFIHTKVTRSDRALAKIFGWKVTPRQNDVLKLKISLIKKRRKWFAALWAYPIDLSQKTPIT
ncbi:MAG: hypothetical protein M9887_04615 [Chitinophagales bacterium]|nr:hypothetical protein [Chitinophagales bacterium]